MSALIRIAAGEVTAYALLNDDTTLVTNWPKQTDVTYITWRASQPEQGVQSELVPGLELGTGNFYGGVSGDIRFHRLSPLMRSYIHDTIMGGKPVALVTAYLHHPLDGFQVYVGELVAPYALNSESSYSRFNDTLYYEATYRFRNGAAVSVSNILLETGDVLLTESGDGLALESQ